MTIFPGKHYYFGLVVLAVINTVWLTAAGHSILFSSLAPVVLNSFIFFCLLVLCKLCWSDLEKKRDKFSKKSQDFLLGYFMPMITTLIGGILYLLLGWAILRLFNHLTMTVPIPYADDFLLSLDSYLPLDWNAYFQFVAERPFLVYILDEAYTGLDVLSVVAFIALVVMANYEKARYFALAFTITAVACTIIGMFFPALAAVEYNLQNKDLLNNFSYSPGTYSVEILERLRSGMPQQFDFYRLYGLTTFPSFHTGAGIVMLYAFRRTFLFWPIVVYTTVMIASTPVYGGHYFVDIIFGTIVAVLVCRLVEAKWFSETFKKHIPVKSSNDTMAQPAE